MKKLKYDSLFGNDLASNSELPCVQKYHYFEWPFCLKFVFHFKLLLFVLNVSVVLITIVTEQGTSSKRLLCQPNQQDKIFQMECFATH